MQNPNKIFASLKDKLITLQIRINSILLLYFVHEADKIAILLEFLSNVYVLVYLRVLLCTLCSLATAIMF